MGTSGSSLAPSGDLEASLAAVGSVAAAADAVVAFLDRCGLPFPSVYLEQGGRLRCEAQRGYWQVLDGVPCDAGVIGRCFLSGETVEVTDASREAAYLFAAPDLQRQISVPLRHAGRVVGSLNTESRSVFPDGARTLMERAAAAFERRVAELGGPPPESTAQRVARLATGMTQLDREEDIRRMSLDAVVLLSGMATAAIIEPDGPSRACLVTAIGPLAEALADVDPGDLGQLDAWVVAGSSLFAHGTEASDLAVHGRLQDAGVAAVGVVPLRASGEHLGSLIVASEHPQPLAASVMPSLEILGAQTAASLRVVRTVAQLRRRARQDPLTGLGHHATFHEELGARLRDRLADRELAVLMIDIDDFKLVNDHGGHQEGDRILRELSATLASVLRTGDQLYRVGGDEFATLVEVAGVEDAQDIAERMIAAVRGGPVTISVGIAIAAPGEAADQLVARADAGMYAAKGSGRDTSDLAPPLAGSH